MFSFGLRAHDFASGEPEEVAAALASYRSLGASAIQLAPYKLFPSWKPPRIDPALARRAAEALGANGMRVAVLGCYINPVHPEPAELERQLARFEDHLSRAADFCCDLVGTETGSASADCSFHPDTSKPETFDRLCRSLERLLVAAEAAGARVGVEPVAYQHTVDSPDAVVRLRSRLDSPALCFIWDPVNLMPASGLSGPDGCSGQGEFFQACASAFGPRIAAVHAKDFIMENGRKRGDLPAGRGRMDYEAFFRVLSEAAPDSCVLLENSSPASVESAFAHLRRAAIRGATGGHAQNSGWR